MNQWFTMFNKDLYEMWRNFKWIWIPLVFVLLGMSDPLTSYYFPKILDALGGLPEGTIIEMPIPAKEEVLLLSMNQLNQIGILIIVLAFMGSIASERKSGLTQILLVKPIPISSYITSKWSSILLISFISLFLGYLSGWYYTSILFDTVPFDIFIRSFLLLFLWHGFVLTITIFFSALSKVSGMAGFLALTVTIILSIATSAFSKWMKWSPAMLNDHNIQLVMSGQTGELFWLPLAVSFAAIALLLIASIQIYKNKELA